MERPNIEDLTLKSFKKRNNVSQSCWKKADITWDKLQKIGIEYQKIVPFLSSTADFIVHTLQPNPFVHSVRWRLKDPEHLLEKIVRKRAAKSAKYKDIDEMNFHKKVTDLIGVRVLHLFKYEWEPIHQFILSKWKPTEPVIAYIRKGDNTEFTSIDGNQDFSIEEHEAGYRSLHYLIELAPTKQNTIAELQVRTLFEEGWSEIDHKVRYPNFSNNELVSYFLNVFNRLAGSADEMGSFVDSLVQQIKEYEGTIVESTKKKNEALNKAEELISMLENEKEKGNKRDETIADLRSQLDSLRLSSIDQMYTADQLRNISAGKAINFDSSIESLWSKPFGQLALNSDKYRELADALTRLNNTPNPLSEKLKGMKF